MDRREFLSSGLAATALATWNDQADAQEERKAPIQIIDVHCHAGRGMNYAKDSSSPPWTTYNDPQWVLDQAQAAGISLSVIFPISNVRYQQANEEIARYVRKHPSRHTSTFARQRDVPATKRFDDGEPICLTRFVG